MLELSLMRGAQSTTAIEGNTLSEADILRIRNGERMPPSRAYQETEVRNILEAFNELLKEIIAEDHSERITPGLIMRLHKMVGKELGAHLDAIPGRFRTDNRIVGTYRCPDHEDVPQLMEQYCRWLLEEFHYPAGQSFSSVVIEAIVAHVYLEWIHPFGDGNGRTGRLLEFYILLRGGLPDIASHILSNHYNDTRPEYYRQLENASRTRDLSDFIHYALQGLRDGLIQVLDVVQESQFSITWQKYIYDTL
ncbi:MAG: Fic family protein, partial [Bacteroidia bacterium]